MTITEPAPSVVDPLANQRARLDLNVRILDALTEVMAERPDLELDAPNSLMDGACWRYHEPTEMRSASGPARRAVAFDWLQRHATAVKLVARKVGHDGPIPKVADDDNYGVEVRMDYGSASFTVDIDALVPASLTCEMVETGEVEVIPAQPEQVVPKMERRCPPSIFAGIESEVDAS